jgi:hypothetical protein
MRSITLLTAALALHCFFVQIGVDLALEARADSLSGTQLEAALAARGQFKGGKKAQKLRRLQDYFKSRHAAQQQQQQQQQHASAAASVQQQQQQRQQHASAAPAQPPQQLALPMWLQHPSSASLMPPLPLLRPLPLPLPQQLPQQLHSSTTAALPMQQHRLQQVQAPSSVGVHARSVTQ